ncbi:protoporphyrinogen oxidase HemJ [Roseinatronobacter alkalisoli]|uniref:Protoporphyrinogen IX oxidase n=1 Tax=Roseinatronobacter alkalisoli TaxID=3028235 RepID=A0ABT5T9R7_9RHOB|nr:protoporphyrinogen oxidase HemJ [Roseinatronobacter sp. HJB301]MDD7971865.1 protoporphyrinogen oxidase HemJ [Roseinatronobacter sp. HJB301]
MLATLYPWIKALHIMAVISWMAGLFYLPRLFVYHVERGHDAQGMDNVFQVMELKLLRVIMNPAMIVAWVSGLTLAAMPWVLNTSAIWPYSKLAALIGMTWFHIWCARRRRIFAEGGNTLTGRHYRMMNEVPTVLMVIIVLSVVVKF